MKLKEYDVYRFGPKRLRWEHMYRDLAIAAGTLVVGVATEEAVRHRSDIEEAIKNRANRRTEIDFVMEKMATPLRESEGRKGEKNNAIGRRVLAATLIEPPQKTFLVIQNLLGLESTSEINDAIHALHSLTKKGLVRVDKDPESKRETFTVSDPLAGYLSENKDMGTKLRAEALSLDNAFTISAHRMRLNEIYAKNTGPVFIGQADLGEV